MNWPKKREWEPIGGYETSSATVENFFTNGIVVAFFHPKEADNEGGENGIRS